MLLRLIRAEKDRRKRVRRYDWRGDLCPQAVQHGPRGWLPGCTHARPSQIIPEGDWRLWLVKAGRGFGKTRTGAEACREWSEEFARIGLIAPTMDDARDIMVEGESGILAVFPQDRPARYIGNRRRIEFPSGAIGTIYSADEPERLRGPQHHKLWMDEIASWRYLRSAFDMAMLGLRLGDNPQAVLTSTPKNLSLIRELRDRSRKEAGSDPLGTVVMTEGSTYENRENLAEAFVHELIVKYEGTRLGRQELMAEVLEDVVGALWTRDMIEYRKAPMIRRGGVDELDMSRVVVAIDPSVTSGDDSDEVGIVVDGIGFDGMGYTLADLSGRMTPLEWARRAVGAYREYRADHIVAEVNNGGDLVSTLISVVDSSVPVRTVHASRGKTTRAEPVSALYVPNEQRKLRWYHVQPFPELEDQMTSYTGAPGEDSPDRMDAHVWGVTDLVLGSSWQGKSDVAVA